MSFLGLSLKSLAELSEKLQRDRDREMGPRPMVLSWSIREELFPLHEWKPVIIILPEDKQ